MVGDDAFVIVDLIKYRLGAYRRRSLPDLFTTTSGAGPFSVVDVAGSFVHRWIET